MPQSSAIIASSAPAQDVPPRSRRIRTCIATRARHPDVDLLRVVLDPAQPESGRVLADPDRNLPGRGAWLTPTIAALELAEQRRAFGRALRTSTPVETGHVRTYLAELAERPDIIRKTEH
ncbi:YlxR family protein [Corynebacterium guangdongense]|uniref:YlxR family protein n=1 Tax=Corynebacterium guangdongense TaxID=1783348 RepID=UPI0025B42530|nr:YlxR family protein [Corynebacterium guangdongense]